MLALIPPVLKAHANGLVELAIGLGILSTSVLTLIVGFWLRRRDFAFCASLFAGLAALLFRLASHDPRLGLPGKLFLVTALLVAAIALLRAFFGPISSSSPPSSKSAHHQDAPRPDLSRIRVRKRRKRSDSRE